MPDEPLTIPYARLVELIDALGVQTHPRHIWEITIKPGSVQVVRYRTTVSGTYVFAGDGAATETIVIAILDRFEPAGQTAPEPAPTPKLPAEQPEAEGADAGTGRDALSGPDGEQ